MGDTDHIRRAMEISMRAGPPTRLSLEILGTKAHDNGPSPHSNDNKIILLSIIEGYNHGTTVLK